MKNFVKIGLLALAVFIAVPSSWGKKIQRPISMDIPFLTEANVSHRYGNLDYSLRIQVNNSVSEYQIIDTNELPKKEASTLPKFNFVNDLTSSVEQYLDACATGLGFNVGGRGNSYFTLKVSIKDYKLRIRDYNLKKDIFSSSGSMVIRWELVDPDNNIVISETTCTGRGTARTLEEIIYPLYISYDQALNGIDWDRIASQMKIAKTAQQEKNKSVSGMGDSALEHTVIRWYIVSKPQGADVSWRVVSSTPDVSNTNANFVGTTPYESTESFDIRGLTYNNSGNVQIEVSCEKPGYITQRKRFNLRQAIDQKEISAKFNLVKEDSEEAE